VRYVPPPPIANLPDLAQIIASVPRSHRGPMAAASASITNSYALYDAARPMTLHQLPLANLPAPARTSIETIFRRRLGRFRELIDGLTTHFESTEDATCPYCNFIEQWEHDHYLPKSVYPEFCLYPWNLVPICKHCNGKKLALFQENGVRLFQHLFSELQGITGFLEVEIRYEPLSVSFSLVNPGTLSATQFEVLQKHFAKLELDRRYAAQASKMLARLVREFRKPGNLGLGRNRLEQRLGQMMTDFIASRPPNHWETALIEHLTASNEFVEHIFTDHD
jgi:hypothetical protein